MAKTSLWNPELTRFQNFFCAWPFVLIIIGGALGVVIGTIAWALNVKIMKRDYSILVAYPVVIFIGLAAFALHLSIAASLVHLLAG